MRSLEECTKSRNDIEIVLSEKRSSFKLMNPDKYPVDVVTIDGCVFENEPSPRCDYLLFLKEKTIEVYVELKGKRNIEHAVDQIDSTISYMICAKKAGIKLIKRVGYIIGCRYPQDNLRLKKLVKKIYEKYRCSIKVKNSNFSVNYDEF
ncbi:MAG: hypothetical protein HQ591_01465 [candidate division Zixibacteria bacterium]|nr:hypothetical protein [Candidatus Tariuqbacter arcticus]